jgi:hypothetical protein
MLFIIILCSGKATPYLQHETCDLLYVVHVYLYAIVGFSQDNPIPLDVSAPSYP